MTEEKYNRASDLLKQIEELRKVRYVINRDNNIYITGEALKENKYVVDKDSHVGREILNGLEMLINELEMEFENL